MTSVKDFWSMAMDTQQKKELGRPLSSLLSLCEEKACCAFALLPRVVDWIGTCERVYQVGLSEKGHSESPAWTLLSK